MKKAIILILLFLSFTYLFGQDKTIKIATLDNYHPYCFTVESGSNIDEVISVGEDSKFLKGYSWDIVREALQKKGYKIELTITTWNRCLSLLDMNRVDLVFPAGKNEEREKKYFYSNKFVNEINFVIYVDKSSKLKWNRLSSLKDLNVGYFASWYFGEEFSNSIDFQKIVVKEDIETGFLLIERGRIDCLAGYDIPFDFVLKNTNKKDNFTKFPSFGSSKEYIIGSKSNKNIKNTISDFDLGKVEIEKSGILKNIINKWK